MLMVAGMFTENVVMMIVRRARAKRGYHERGTGLRAAFRRLFPPPPQEDDPPKLRLVYKIASKCVWVGFAGMVLMFGSLMVGLTVMKR
jgi:hypothetical protein